ncbi:hypothetical protein U3516DRAFT_791405 [Neocallimastix sp. 'constans']
MDKILIPEEEDLIASPSQSKNGSIYNGKSAPNSPVIKEAPGSIKSYNGISNRVKGDSVSETINYNNSFASSFDNNNTYNSNNNSKKKYKRSISDLSSLNELFESIDKSVMDSVNKNNITLPLLIKTQLEVYQDIPTYDPSKDKMIQKSYSIGCIDKNKKELNLNNSQSTLSLNLDGYRANDDYSESPTDNKKSFLRHEHDKINKIMDKLSISSNMDGIHNLMSRLSSRDFVPSNSEPVTTSKFKENGDYLELAKIV